ncbi:iron ABC transporter permease [Microvirga sp. 17 mud 1-3]|uniref:ABC transporter permease n=1 Tax=Microvirga sp. 17 mud 1-3 TaxID=2082949 RepID=UPI000D6D19BA|nr:iron ABC transporter permease [Microvirga sp. 17 mud 1-3]AWM85467.1 ABC transporter permease [Microvirga sp. 17 mud 1-3]
MPSIALASVTKSSHGRDWTLYVIYPVVALFVLIFTAYPMLDLLTRAFIVDGRSSLATIGAVVFDPFNRTIFWNTLFLGATVAVLGTILATLYAYAIARVAIPGKSIWHFFALLPTISPPILMALGLILLYGRRGLITHELFGLQSTGLYGFKGLVIAQLISYFPFAYLLMLNLFRGLDASLEEAAATMGANGWRVLGTVSLPLLVPGLAGSALLMFSYSFADLGNPLLLGGDFPVLSSQIYQSIIGMYDIPHGAALAVLLLIPAVLMFFAHKMLTARMSFASVGAKGSSRHREVRHRGVQAAALLLVSSITFIICLQYGTIIAGATTQLFGIDYSFTSKHFVAALTKSGGTLLDTLTLGVIASFISVVLGLLIAWIVARSKATGRSVLDFIANLPLAIPGTVIGLAFGLAFNGPPLMLTGTATIIIAAFAVRSLPYGIRSGVAALNQVNRTLDEASTTMGATSGQTLWRVLLPLVRPALLAGMVFSFTRSVTTLSAVIFVVSPHWSLVTPTILSQMDRGDVGEAAALSVIVVLMVLLIIHGVPRLLGRDWREAH